MSRPLEIIAAEVMQLSDTDRELLLERLAASLPKDPDWETAWAQEADRREAAMAADGDRWIPGDELLARLRAKLS